MSRSASSALPDLVPLLIEIVSAGLWGSNLTVGVEKQGLLFGLMFAAGMAHHSVSNITQVLHRGIMTILIDPHCRLTHGWSTVSSTFGPSLCLSCRGIILHAGLVSVVFGHHAVC